MYVSIPGQVHAAAPYRPRPPGGDAAPTAEKEPRA